MIITLLEILNRDDVCYSIFRRITCLTYLNDDFDGGALDFRYWSERGYLPYKPPAGSLVIMPSGFMWSHATTPLLNGRKSAFLVAVSSGTDYDKYLETLDIEQTAQGSSCND